MISDLWHSRAGVLVVANHSPRAGGRPHGRRDPQARTGGRLGFHAYRLAHINLVIESGTTVKETQALAQHATPAMTMNTYGLVSEERLAAAVAGIAQKLPLGAEGVLSLYGMAVGAKAESATPYENKELRSLVNGGGGGSRTQDLTSSPTNTCATQSEQNRVNSKHCRALPDSGSAPQEQKSAVPRHYEDTSLRPENVPSMYGDGTVLPLDLAQVVASWASLPAEVRARIVGMARATGHGEG